MEKSNDFMKSPYKELDVANSESNTSTGVEINRRPTEICFYYSNYEYCRFGNKCKFLHHRTNAPREFVSRQFSTSRMERNQNKKMSPVLAIKKKFPIERERNLSNPQNSNDYKKSCRYYKAGNCDKGEKCLFSHSLDHNTSTVGSSQAFLNATKDVSRTSVDKKMSVPVCQYFKRGFCNNGNMCTFYHPQKFVPKVNRFSSIDKNQRSSQYKEIDRKGITSSGPRGSKNEDSIENEDKNNSTTTAVAQNSSYDTNVEDIDQNEFGKLHKQTYINLIHYQTQLNSVDFENSKTNEESISDPKQLSGNKYTEDLPQIDDIYVNSVNSDAVNVSKESIRIPLSANKVFSLSSTETKIPQLRFTEIAQFMKRFPSYEVIKENQSFAFTFQPSDPDWPFDMEIIKLQVTFPEMYPKEICNINVIRSADYIPETLFRHLNQSISDWLNNRHKASFESKQVELVFRPFLKWFDRNIEDLFNCGLKREKQDIEITDDNLELTTTQELSLSTDAIPSKEKNTASPEISAEEKHITKELSQVSISRQKNTPSSSVCTSQKQGVKVLFIGLEFIEGVAALTCTKVAAMLQCIRCKTSHNIKSPLNKNHSVTCSKCSKCMESNFNPSLLHQFSNVLGTIHLVECQVVDINLVESAFLVDCLNCSKQVGVNGIHYGQKQKFWCMFCNQKLVISIGSVKFQASAPTYATTKIADKAVKKTEKKKDPLIKEGSPLPQFGACKHYKKSNRWLRFPCCGRVYPCDVCHEEKEMDHEMKFASRMICGFCSKEQPYSKEKPCISCTSGMVAKSGTHWEGGKGCRNKVKMARDDKHKYAGTSKTTSKKAQNSGNKKK